MLIGTSRLVLFVLMVRTIHSDRAALDFFNERWQLDKDLQCIHRKVQHLGLNVTAKPNEPSYNGFRTYCFFLQQGAHFVYIYKWPDGSGDFLGVVFVQGKPPYTPVYKEGQKIESCQTFLDLQSNTKPSWIRSKNPGEIERNLRTTCFYVTRKDGPVVYKYVFKISYHAPSGRELAYFDSNRISFLVPNKENVEVTSREADLDKLCTRCAGGGGFSQFETLKGSNLTGIWEKTLEKFNAG